MNRETFTSKTGITSILAILATGVGIYTGTVPLLVGGQSIVGGLLALFLKDGQATQLKATEKAIDASETAAVATNNLARSLPPANQSKSMRTQRDVTEGGGA